MNGFLEEIKDESLDQLDSFFETDTPESKGEENKKTSNKILISHTDDKKLIDTLFDGNETHFVEYDRLLKTVSKKVKTKIKNILYYPINPNSGFIDNGLILFAGNVTEYDSEKQLIEDIRAFIHKYVDIQEELEIVCVYYIIMTYFFQKFTEVPYLRVIGDYGSGKSRFLKTIGGLCHNPIIVNGGLSSSALFRILDTVKGTLVFDEADLRQSDTTNEVVKILNNGYQKGQSIIRADGNKFEVNSYSVFGPKVIGSREDFKDKALESRCITFIMKRTTRDDIKRNLDDDFEMESLELRNKLLNYKYQNFDKITLKEEVIEGLEPRLNQIINPILSVILDEDDKEIVMMNSLNYQDELKKDRYLSLEGQIFQTIHDLFLKSESVAYQSIVYEIGIDYKLHPRKLGSILKNHGIIAYRTNKGFQIDKSRNSDVLDKHYGEYCITTD